MPSTLLLVVVVGFPCLVHAAPDDDPMEYHIDIGERLRRLTVKLCFGRASVPAALMVPEPLAKHIEDLSATFTDGVTKKLQIDDHTIELGHSQIQCVHYTVQIPDGQSKDWRSGRIEHNGAMTVALERILVRPNMPRRWRRTRLSFSTAPGVRVSAPGAMLPANGVRKSFELLDRPSAWAGSVAFGTLTQSLIAAGKAQIRLSIVGRSDAATTAVLHTWITTGVAAITTLYGHFPVSDLQILVFPLGRNSDPVPWGEVVRGGGDAVHLYVDGTRSLAELNDNWVLAHELSHLFHPYIAAPDSWLPEGIASYYQNVLRARAGLIDAATAWEKLDAGFKRGLAQFASDRTLAADTRAMMRQRQYMRVYWSGAAINLIGDVKLRRRSHGIISLDTVFDAMSRCCMVSRRRWPARELMAKIDEIAGFEVFIPLYERYVIQPVFPDLDETYRHLGLKRVGGSLEFSDDPAAIQLRAAIMGR